jgi:hypothetical protein
MGCVFQEEEQLGEGPGREGPRPVPGEDADRKFCAGGKEDAPRLLSGSLVWFGRLGSDWPWRLLSRSWWSSSRRTSRAAGRSSRGSA